MGSGPFSPIAPRPFINWPFVPQTLLKGVLPPCQMGSRFWFLMYSGSKKKEPNWACLIEAKASHQQRVWAEVSSSTPHFLHSGLSINPIKWRCLCRVLCLVRSPVTTLDCSLLKDKNLTLVPDWVPVSILEPVVGNYRGRVCIIGV
jgi:hypothetical protein